MTETLTFPEIKRPAPPAKKSPGRLAFLDWTRGLAATIMLQGHVFHSFTRTDLREDGPYVLSQFVGGITPAIFLFLTGITLAFMMDGMERRGEAFHSRVTGTLRRAAYLGVLALAFRLQLWLFGWPSSPVSDLLKVDILNCMAVAIATFAGFSLMRTTQRVHAGIGAGVLIAAAAPLVSLLEPTNLPQLVRMYFRPDANYFSYFPWASFLAFGVGAGSILRLVKAEHMHRLMQWSAIIGFGVILASQYVSNLPYSLYPSVDYWLNSPGLIFVKLGVILILMPLAFLWTQLGGGQGWSWVRQLGTTSLLVYWVHIELVYGRWFGFWKESLTAAQCALVSIVLIIFMIGLSWMRTNWKMPDLRFMGLYQASEPRRVSGD